MILIMTLAAMNSRMITEIFHTKEWKLHLYINNNSKSMSCGIFTTLVYEMLVSSHLQATSAFELGMPPPILNDFLFLEKSQGYSEGGLTPGVSWSENFHPSAKKIKPGTF